MKDRKYQIGCLYCDFFRLHPKDCLSGICLKMEKTVNIGNEICDDFVIKSGMHTNLSYPEK